MNTKKHGHDTGQAPHHKDVSFEGSDIETKVIYRYLLFLAISVIAAFLVCILIERAAMSYSLESETQMAPSRAAAGSAYNGQPPEPRLQGVPGHEKNPPQDLRDKLELDNQANATSQWVDKNAGIAQIPVSEAMKILAEKGAAGAAPSTTEQKKTEPKKIETKKVEPKKAEPKK